MDTQQELVQLARQIAKTRGYTTLYNGLQPLEDYNERGETRQGLKSKFAHELTEELRECVAMAKERVWYYSEAADCLYYGACIDEIAPEQRAYETALMTLASPSYRIERVGAEMAALAKYRFRAGQPYRKDKELPDERALRDARENQAIEAALSSIEKWPGWPLAEVAEMFDIPPATLYYACDLKEPSIPCRRVGRVILINIKHPLWYRWYGGYKRTKARE